jgi:hypothetical protein
MPRVSIEKKAAAVIRGHGRGWVFTPRHLAALGDARSIGMALTRLTRQGTIRRLARGLYDYPETDPALGVLAPRAEAVARALAGRDAVRLQPTGANAANLLGLSEQVPARIAFLTDGPSRTVVLGRRRIELKRTTPRQMATAGRVSGTVIQALRWLGKRHVDDRTIAALERRLSANDRKQLLQDLRFAPAWIANLLRRIAQAEAS